MTKYKATYIGFSSTIEEAMMNFKAYITGKEV